MIAGQELLLGDAVAEAVLDVGWKVVEGGVVRARLYQQNGVVGVLSKAGGEYRASGTGAHDVL